MVFCFFFKFFKTFQDLCYLKFYTVITNPHSSKLTYIILFLFKSQIFLLITIFIPINKFKCSIRIQLLLVLYLLFKHYSMWPYVTSQSPKKKRRKVMVRFYLDHMCPPTPFNPHHSSHKYLSSLWPAIHFLSFVFFLFLTNTPWHSPTGTSMPPPPPSFFWQCYRKILRNL